VESTPQNRTLKHNHPHKKLKYEFMSPRDSITETQPVGKTPDYDVPGIVDLTKVEEGDEIYIHTRKTALTVTETAKRTLSFSNGIETVQRAIAAEHDRKNSVPVEIVESVNRADGDVIELVNRDTGTPLRVFLTKEAREEWEDIDGI
jgi:hypothetical protein